jgi:hypothetical protein
MFESAASFSISKPKPPTELATLSWGDRLEPVIRRQRDSPDISWFIQFDSAMKRLLGIYIDHASADTFVVKIDVDRDAHPDV